MQREKDRWKALARSSLAMETEIKILDGIIKRERLEAEEVIRKYRGFYWWTVENYPEVAKEWLNKVRKEERNEKERSV